MIRAYYRVLGVTKYVTFDTDCMIHARYLAIEYFFDHAIKINSSILLVLV